MARVLGGADRIAAWAHHPPRDVVNGPMRGFFPALQVYLIECGLSAIAKAQLVFPIAQAL